MVSDLRLSTGNEYTLFRLQFENQTRSTADRVFQILSRSGQRNVLATANDSKTLHCWVL